MPVAKIVTFLFLFSIVTSNHLQAAMQHPTQNITISIDLSRQRLFASATIVAPSETDIDISLAGLDVQSVIVNGKQVTPAPQTPFSDITLSGSPGEAIVNYQLDCSEKNSSQCLINEHTAIMTGIWHPLLNQETLFSLKADIPPHFEAVSEADKLESTTTDAGKKQVSFHFPHAVKTINFVAGPYIVEEEIFGTNNKLLSYFFNEDKDLASTYRKKAKTYLERYIKEIGPYPYERFAIVENRFPTGYAIPTFTLLGQSVVRLPFITETSLGHEVLHAWFGNAVKPDIESGNWSEGLTTYLADQTYAADKEEGALFRKNQLIKYQSYVTEDNAISLENFLGSGPGRSREQQAQRATGYGKASMLFHMLRNRVGNVAFYKSVKLFYTEMKGKTASWHDIQNSFEKTTGHDLQQFFTQWLSRKDIPKLEILKPRLEEKDGSLALSFSIKQSSKNPYELKIPLHIEANGQEETRLISIADTETDFAIPLKNYPDAMAIDPDYSVMRKLADRELPKVWSRFMGAENTIAIIDSNQDKATYAPLISYLESMGTGTIEDADTTEEIVTQNSIIFLGCQGKVARGLFGQTGTFAQGFTLDVRQHPLTPANVAVLVRADSLNEVQAATRKLQHYGKYSRLQFKNGKVIKKQIAPSDTGQRYLLDEAPKGIQTKKSLDFSQIINAIKRNRVIYVGEAHTRYADHKLQLRVIRELFNSGANLAIGMEMFPRSSQKALDAFIAEEINELSFLKQSHYFKVWSYDYRLYREILNFARKNNIPVIGLNIEKDTVSKVYKEGGVLNLALEARETIPLDRIIDMPNYRERINAVYSFHPNHGGKSHFSSFLQSQIIWDETMAESIADYLRKNKEKQMVILAGSAHVIKENAIPPRVRRRIPVSQAIITNSDGHAVYPEEQDYIVFSAPAQLPEKVLMGISMREDAEAKLVTIDSLSPHGGAKKSGLQEGDIILSMDGEAIAALEDVKIIMLFKEKGDTVELKIKRPHTFFADEELSFTIEL